MTDRLGIVESTSLLSQVVLGVAQGLFGDAGCGHVSGETR